jgi:hypothetical protein
MVRFHRGSPPTQSITYDDRVSRAENNLRVVGRCRICGSQLDTEVSALPASTSRRALVNQPRQPAHRRCNPGATSAVGPAHPCGGCDPTPKTGFGSETIRRPNSVLAANQMTVGMARDLRATTPGLFSHASARVRRRWRLWDCSAGSRRLDGGLLRLRQLARNGGRRYGVPIGNDIRQLRAIGRREHDTERGHEHAQLY